MILDATAGNRTMWNWKNIPGIIYIDMEKKLDRKPTIFADNTNTPFLPRTFDTIFYDPPHSWDTKTGFFSFPDREGYNALYKGNRKFPTYYGWDKYKTKQALVAHVYRAQKEFYRILKDDGLLWLKWNELTVPFKKIIPVLDLWGVLLFLRIKSLLQVAGTAQTYWVCMAKDPKETVQTILT